MEEQPAPPTPAPPPIANGNAEALPLPPCFLELVKQQAERVLPGKACTPMLLQRANMLMQDTVDAACMCMRAHVDSPLLLKHLLGTEHYQSFLTSDKAKALALAEEEGALASRELDAWSSLVTEHVGEVGPPPWGRRPPPAHRRAPTASTPPIPSSTSATHCYHAAGICSYPRRGARADLRQPVGVDPQAARGPDSRRLLLLAGRARGPHASSADRRLRTSSNKPQARPLLVAAAGRPAPTMACGLSEARAAHLQLPLVGAARSAAQTPGSWARRLGRRRRRRPQLGARRGPPADRPCAALVARAAADVRRH